MPAQLFKITKPQTPNEKKTRTVVDTILVTPTLLDQWKSPPFQRPVRENEKVRALAEELKTESGVWPGIITLGVLEGITYVIDGQHRKAAFLLSGLTEGYTDVRIHHFTSMAEMGEEFVRLNSQLVRLRPDDILRGLESSLPGMKRLRETCPFIGYDNIRRPDSKACAIIGMSRVLRVWRGSAGESPNSNCGGMSGMALAASMQEKDFEELSAFMQLTEAAWGRDVQYARLYSSLNLMLIMWLYRRLVFDTPDGNAPRTHRGITRTHTITKELFKKCLMSISAAGDYLDWLVGRNSSERDRSPAYARLKAIFVGRLVQEIGHKVNLPQPPWATNK